MVEHMLHSSARRLALRAFIRRDRGHTTCRGQEVVCTLGACKVWSLLNRPSWLHNAIRCPSRLVGPCRQQSSSGNAARPKVRQPPSNAITILFCSMQLQTPRARISAAMSTIPSPTPLHIFGTFTREFRFVCNVLILASVRFSRCLSRYLSPERPRRWGVTSLLRNVFHYGGGVSLISV